MDPCLKHLVKQVAKAFVVPAFEVEEALSAPSRLPTVQAFLAADGPLRLVIYRTASESDSQADLADDVAPDDIHVTADEAVQFSGKAVILLKLSEVALDASNIDAAVHCSIVFGPIKTLLATLSQVYVPTLAGNTAWRSKLNEDNSNEFVQGVSKFVDMLSEAVSSTEGGLELPRPEGSFEVENRQPVINRAGALLRPRRHLSASDGNGGRWGRVARGQALLLRRGLSFRRGPASSRGGTACGAPRRPG